MNYSEKKEQLEKQIQEIQDASDKKLLKFMYILFGLATVGASFSVTFNSIILVWLTFISSAVPLAGIYKNFIEERKDIAKLLKYSEQLDIDEQNRIKKEELVKRINLSVEELNKLKDIIINSNLSGLSDDLIKYERADGLFDKKTHETLSLQSQNIVIENKTSNKCLKKIKTKK